jgi:2-succinyl-5-enolpyruvyl-6-hydroxy-3-cyclohexene-1-carboxylate synthase
MTDHRAAAYATTEAILAELVRGGVRHVVLSPGSRSTALALAADRRSDLTVHVVLDERSAGFIALGIGTVSGDPVAMICSSGTATANYLPAVVEANRSRVQLVVLTADRPVGFLDRDAPQTIEQVNLYGVHVVASVSLPVAHEVEPARAADLVAEALAQGRAPNAGPVHVNCPYDKPLEPPDEWPEPTPVERLAMDAKDTDLVNVDDGHALAAFLDASQRGIVVAGPRRASAAELDAVIALGWPILADPLSGYRQTDSELVVTTGELLLRDAAFAESSGPDAVIRTGGTPTGRATQAWLDGLTVPTLIVDPDFRWTASGDAIVIRSEPHTVFDHAVFDQDRPVDSDWFGRWQAAEASASQRRRVERVSHPDSEVSIAATVAASADTLWSASSMAIRHLDVMLERSSNAALFSNRGANGIDGTIASAVGAAIATGERATLLLGDLAFLHDVGSFTPALELGVDLSIVVLHNRGGRIFSILPIAGTAPAFDRLFTTEHHCDLVAIAVGFGANARRVRPPDLADALGSATGVTVLVVETDPVDTHMAYERMVGG